MPNSIRPKLLFLLIISILLPSEVRAKDEKSNIYSNNIGVCAGFVTGFGLSYRHWFPGGNGFQVTVFPYYDVDEEPHYDKYVIVSAGVTGLRAIHLERPVNLFFYYGLHYYYYYNHDSYGYIGSEYDEETGRYRSIYGQHLHKEQQLYLGCGPGIDIHFWRLSLNIMVGFAGRLELPDGFGINPSAEGALYYTIPKKRKSRIKKKQ